MGTDMAATPERWTRHWTPDQLEDLFDMARIAETCEHIHIFQRTCVLRDIPDNYEMDLNTLYCSVMGTSKHVGSRWTDVLHLETALKMLHVIAGGEIKRVAQPGDLASQIQGVGTQGAPQAYAEAGIWYDALDVLSAQIGDRPSDTGLRAQRTSPTACSLLRT